MRRAAILAAVLFWTAWPAGAQDDELRSFDMWLTDSITARIQTAVGSRSPSNQIQAPAMAANATTLVDTTSASDLVGFALNLAGLTGSSEGDGDDATSGNATVSGYALYAAATGRDPLDPEIYCKPGAQRMRLVSGNVGFDDGDADTPDTVIAGAKLKVPLMGLGGNVCATGEGGDFAAVQSALEDAVDAYGGTTDQVMAGLLEALRKSRGNPELGMSALENAIDTPPELAAVLEELGDSTVKRILDESIDASAEAILDETVRKAIRNFEQQPRFAVEFLTKQRDGGADDYMVAGLLDWRVPGTAIALTLNGAWEAKDTREDDEQGGKAALALEYRLPDRDLTGPSPLSFKLAASGKWMTDMGDEYKGQLTVTIPILDGVQLPVSVTVANRTELVDESEVRGLVGFSVDTARLTPLISSVGDLLSR